MKIGSQPFLVSVIIPSLNQGQYLEETILSILNQNYSNLELIIIDGGSTDDSVEIIKKYENKIKYWVSEKDLGQSDAINKGLEIAKGDWISYLNSDDCYLPGAFDYLFTQLDITNFDFLYGNAYAGKSVVDSVNNQYLSNTKDSLYKLLQFFYDEAFIVPSQSVFIKNSLIKKTGGLDINLHYCMDFDWYCRMFILKPNIFFYEKSISFFRLNETTKTGTQHNKMKHEAISIAEKYKQYLNGKEQKKISKLISYYTKFLTIQNDDFLKLYKLLCLGVLYPSIAFKHISYRILLLRLLYLR